MGDAFNNLLTNAVNVLGNDGIAAATQTMQQNGYQTPIVITGTGPGYGATAASSSGGLGTLILLGVVAFLIFK